MKLVWSDPAVGDLEAIHQHISQDSEFYAAGFIARILKLSTDSRRLPGSEISGTLPQQLRRLSEISRSAQQQLRLWI